MSQASPLISVCIANYNGETLLVDCIDSVLSQKGDLAVEILVHDDASTDRSVEVLSERYSTNYDILIRVIASDQNVGFCVANNRMAAEARGDYLLLLNNDAALADDALMVLLATSEKQSPQGILSLAQRDWQSGELIDRGCYLDPFYNPVPNTTARRSEVAMVIGACMWLPKSLWIKMGGFPEWFESIAEDMYLCCRARLGGYPVNVVAASHYRHKQGVSFSGPRESGQPLVTTYRRRRLSERNKTVVLFCCTPGSLMWLLLPLHLGHLLIEALILTAIKRDQNIWRDIYQPVFSSLWAWRRLLLAHRSSVQKDRIVGSREYFSAFVPWLRKLELLLNFGWPNIRA